MYEIKPVTSKHLSAFFAQQASRGPFPPPLPRPTPRTPPAGRARWPCRAGGADVVGVRASEGLLLEGGFLGGADDGLVVGGGAAVFFAVEA